MAHYGGQYRQTPHACRTTFDRHRRRGPALAPKAGGPLSTTATSIASNLEGRGEQHHRSTAQDEGVQADEIDRAIERSALTSILGPRRTDCALLSLQCIRKEEVEELSRLRHCLEKVRILTDLSWVRERKKLQLCETMNLIFETELVRSNLNPLALTLLSLSLTACSTTVVHRSCPRNCSSVYNNHGRWPTVDSN